MNNEPPKEHKRLMEKLLKKIKEEYEDRESKSSNKTPKRLDK